MQYYIFNLKSESGFTGFKKFTGGNLVIRGD